MTAFGSAAVGAGRSPAKTRKPAAFESAIQQTSSYASGEPSMSCACARTILATEFETMLFLSTPFEYTVSVFLNRLWTVKLTGSADAPGEP